MEQSKIEGWVVVQVLGEGAFGDVKLLFNETNGWTCAMKEINLEKHPEAEELVKKETIIHKMVKHDHVVECHGSRRDGKLHYIFLEYCRGGELFDRIEPDVGMPEFCAQKYFRQLISAVEYLHTKGITHRDIKPENLLLDENDILKLSDFGMATVFRHQGKERLLERRCGTLPYIAPEILVKSEYAAEPADIWSCGMVLLAMLTGELPWDQPTSDQIEFLNWENLEYNSGVWAKVNNVPLALLRKVLKTQPSRRSTIPEIKNHVWVTKPLKETDSRSTGNAEKRVCLNAFSQPTLSGGEWGDTLSGQAPQDQFHGFSQPVQPDLLLLATQGTQSSQSPMQQLVRRMTRFLVSADREAAAQELRTVLDSLHFAYKMAATGVLTVHTLDKRGMALVFKATIVVLEGQVLLDFRLSKGDGIEFKRSFMKIRNSMSHLILKDSQLWASLLPSSSQN